LDHLNPDLRAALKDWLGWLQRGIGFGGWRLDFVKGCARGSGAGTATRMKACEHSACRVSAVLLRGMRAPSRLLVWTA
jgi:hypothetical protein